MNKKPTSLYIHIPFCKNICSFCDFTKIIYNQERVDKYIDILIDEIKEFKIGKLKTIYIGGGTPSALDEHSLKKLLSFFMPFLSNNYEFSFECNVEDINNDLLVLLKEYGVNRLSIGVQSFNENFIAFSKRKHDKNMAINNIKLAASYFDNLSIDMIYAFPNQTLEDINKELDIIETLPIKHLSYYSLQIEKGTYIYSQNIKSIDDDLQYEMARLITKRLNKIGIKRYEISNYAKSGYQSRHNKVYWNNNHYYAAGAAASGYIGNIRYTNTRSVMQYLCKHNEQEVIRISAKDAEFEQIMLNLRLTRGLNINNFKKHYDFTKYQDIIDNLIKHKMLKMSGSYLKTTFRGSMVLNSILEEFML